MKLIVPINEEGGEKAVVTYSADLHFTVETSKEKESGLAINQLKDWLQSRGGKPDTGKLCDLIEHAINKAADHG